jgi:hypothetical protein
LNPSICFLNGPQQGQEIPLTQQETTLGRSSQNTIAIPWDTSISRQHARIFDKSGLLWVDDLGSKNGSFLCLPGGAETQLKPHEPHLLLEHARLRLGKHVLCEILGIVTTEDDAMRTAIGGVRNLLQALYDGLPYLDAQVKKEQIALIRRFEQNLLEAANEEELMRIAAEGFNTLHETQEGPTDHPPEESGERPLILDPLPDDLPDPMDPDRLFTIRGIFISDIRKCLPNNHNEGSDHD